MTKSCSPLKNIVPRGGLNSIIEKSLQEHSKLSTRQENDLNVDIDKLFTDNKQITTLQKTDWQILYGRRGTGKTTLLFKLADVIDSKPEKFASLTLSLQKCTIDLPSKIPDETKGLVQFEKFIMEIGFLLYRIYLNRTKAKNKNRRITKLLLDKLTPGNRIIQDTILKIATFAHKGTTYGALIDNRRKKIVERVINQKKSNFGIGSQVDVSLLKDASKFSLYAEAAIKKGLTITEESEYQETAVIDFTELRHDFIELLDELHIETLFILIDEWSALDRHLSPRCQVYFAEYLKRAFFGTPRICLKISAIEHESKFEDFFQGNRIGLEVGADIFVQVNLDQIYNNRVINLREFFEELIYRRLRYCEPTMDQFKSRENNNRPLEAFWDLLFHQKSGFEELINASGGIPRDFIMRFDEVVTAYDGSIEKKWQEGRILDVIIKNSITRTDEHVRKDPFLSCVFGKIEEVVKSNGDNVFLIPKTMDDELSKAIESLFASRLIHKFDLVIVPAHVRSKYDAYFLDYGTFVDITRIKRKTKQVKNTERPVQEHFPNEQLEKFIVNVQSCQTLRGENH